MFDWLRENAISSESSLKKTTALISLWLLALLFLSCDGSGSSSGGSGAGANIQRGVFPPVVFMADKDRNNMVELYASFADGADIFKLSGDMVAGGNVVDFAVSPSGFWVAYVADQDTDELFELYVVPVDKDPDEKALKISVELAGSGVREIEAGTARYYFAWAPNSSRVAYIADAADSLVELPNYFELFSSTPDGSQKNLISDLDDEDSDVEDFEWEPNSTLLAYVADQDRDDVIELYTAAADGASLTAGAGIFDTIRVSGAMAGSGIKENPADSGNWSFAWAPDSSWIAYLADQLVSDKFELFTSTPDGDSNNRISGVVADDADVREFKWAPSGGQVAYTANHKRLDAIDLFTGSKNGSGSPQLNSSGLTADQQVLTFKWAPDSSRIAFTSDRQTTGFFRLFTVQPVNNNNILVSGGLLATSDVTDFKWQADNFSSGAPLLIAYLVDARQFELYTTLPASASSTQITGRSVFPGDVFDYQWAPDNSRIAYTADFDEEDVVELFSSLADNSETFNVSGELVSGGDVGIFEWAPDSSGVGYIADQDFDNVNELFASQAKGESNTLLSGELVEGGDVIRFEWVP